jgi:hypothetical protein
MPANVKSVEGSGVDRLHMDSVQHGYVHSMTASEPPDPLVFNISSSNPAVNGPLPSSATPARLVPHMVPHINGIPPQTPLQGLDPASFEISTICLCRYTFTTG